MEIPEAFDWAFLLDGEDVMINRSLEDRGNSVFLVDTEDGECLVKRNSSLDGENYNAWEEVEK